MLLLYPGQQSQMVSLQECLRQAHEQDAEERAKEIARRAANSIPLDDSTDWAAVSADMALLSEAVGAHDTAQVATVSSRMCSAVGNHKLEPLPTYEPDHDIDGIAIQFAVMSDADRRMLVARMGDGWTAMRNAVLRGASQSELQAIDEQIAAAQAEMIRLGCVAIDGGGQHITDIEGAIPALRRSGLFGSVFRAVRAFQELPAKKAMRFGLLPLSTSEGTTTAGPAAPNGVAYWGAMAAGSHTLPTPSTRPEHAHVVTSSTMQT